MPDGGLITPVLKEADATDIYQLSRNWADLVKRARAKQLQPDECERGFWGGLLRGRAPEGALGGNWG
jgi:pyruvate/2-oxoglutarate dehydrogenase complex dihydrolipoamide acyltransferase (E2) component